LEVPVAGGEGVVQKLCWIEPGTFLMGSPEDEAERLEAEGPRHEVTISKGFWLFTTACTQALWQAVMGNNPSHFKGSDRPVDSVSWDQAQAFLSRINNTVPGLELVLPSEAQWEYACRARTTTPFSFGETVTPEQVNYDGNYPYGGGRTGLFRNESVSVASLPANEWGLYEMHGNVWEWCCDGMRAYAPDPVTDPLGPTHDGVWRMLRGGSWIFSPGAARSAFRLAADPGSGLLYSGFRCAQAAPW
jgi:formylglycine-generating enzyme required for sulfatase activity